MHVILQSNYWLFPHRKYELMDCAIQYTHGLCHDSVLVF